MKKQKNDTNKNFFHPLIFSISFFNQFKSQTKQTNFKFFDQISWNLLPKFKIVINSFFLSETVNYPSHWAIVHLSPYIHFNLTLVSIVWLIRSFCINFQYSDTIFHLFKVQVESKAHLYNPRLWNFLLFFMKHLIWRSSHKNHTNTHRTYTSHAPSSKKKSQTARQNQSRTSSSLSHPPFNFVNLVFFLFYTLLHIQNYWPPKKNKLKPTKFKTQQDYSNLNTQKFNIQNNLKEL